MKLLKKKRHLIGAIVALFVMNVADIPVHAETGGVMAPHVVLAPSFETLSKKEVEKKETKKNEAKTEVPTTEPAEFTTQTEQMDFEILGNQMSEALRDSLLDRTKNVKSSTKVTTISAVTAEGLNSKLSGELAGKGQLFIDLGNQYSIDPAFLAAICMHESNKGNSSAIRKHHNVAGLMRSSGGQIHFSSVDESITYFAGLLSGSKYVASGLDTPEKIQKRYCPIGATNDPTNLNANWLGGVIDFWKGFRETIV